MTPSRTAIILAALFAGAVASLFGTVTALLASYELVPSWLGVSAPFLLFAWGASLGGAGMSRALRRETGEPFLPLTLALVVASGVAGLLSFAAAKHAWGLAQAVVFFADLAALLGTLPFALAVAFTTRAVSRALVRRLSSDLDAGAEVKGLASRATPRIASAALAKALFFPLELALPSTTFVVLLAAMVAAVARRYLALAGVLGGALLVSFPTLALMEKMAALPAEQQRISALPQCWDDVMGRGAYSLAAEKVDGVASAKTYFHSGYADEPVLKVTLTLGPTQRTKDDVLANVDAVLRDVKCRRVDTEELSDHMEYVLNVSP